MPPLKLLEDLIALARTGSFVRAAEARHVTHPAFGRRIRALEAWAGAPLVMRDASPVVLTPQGQLLLGTAGQVVEQLERVRQQLQQVDAEVSPVLRIATGRSLAGSLVADWIALLHKGPRPALGLHTRVEIVTGMMADMAALLEQNKTDLLCCYEHPALSTQLRPGQYLHMTLAVDRLVPVCQSVGNGQPRFALEQGQGSLPLISYSGGLAMARIVGDRLQNLPYPLVPLVHCDSLDAALGTVSRGLGIAWLPWSMVAGECRRGSLQVLGGRSEQIAFEVRLYRANARLPALAEAVWSAAQTLYPEQFGGFS
ncbi:LysR family transcriptional regulator [Corticibacter populi]|uniref:LysR family transcriptional regulator n=1 Tax=Corticibacter populi TaxID=1550736 RepID=A0A3M6QZ85_9BURK|nr:LysR family transcriptional regulator [Corticibacter populi]RMX08346.1 LysR family transcriptional regulator [Corticibacter populi]RZS35639.1 DNA-binding transcriptional LysR family regulator [Corticibacter populi]